jgi:hypothetical protein
MIYSPAKKSMATTAGDRARERHRFCRECGAPNKEPTREPDGSLRFECTEHPEHIVYFSV